LKLIKLSLRLKYLRKNALSEFKNIMNDILSKCSIFWKYLSLLFSSLYKVFKFFTKLLFKHDVITISELWIAPNIFIFQDKMTPLKQLSSTEDRLSKAHACQDNVCFKTTFFLVNKRLRLKELNNN
jgi:hypothetical protein